MQKHTPAKINAGDPTICMPQYSATQRASDRPCCSGPPDPPDSGRTPGSPQRTLMKKATAPTSCTLLAMYPSEGCTPYHLHFGGSSSPCGLGACRPKWRRPGPSEAMAARCFLGRVGSMSVLVSQSTSHPKSLSCEGFRLSTQPRYDPNRKVVPPRKAVADSVLV